MDNNSSQSISHSLTSQTAKVFSAVEATSEAFFVTDTKGRIEYANKNFLKINAWKEEHALGRSISEIPHSKNIALKLLETLNQGKSWSMRHQIASSKSKKREGKLIWVRTTVDPIIELDNEITGFIGVQRVIQTEVERELQSKKELSNVLSLAIKQEKKHECLNKSYEEALLQVVTKSEFLANMSHEIRTPLSGVLGMTELLQGTDLSNKQTHLTDIIQQSGRNLLNLINDILDLSKIEANKLELKEASYDLRLVIEEVTRTFYEQARSKGIELSCSYPANDHSLFIFDKQRIIQILNNFINNAIKFTTKGEVSIVVNIDNTANGTSLRFEVNDTGTSISDADQESIFGSFSQSLQSPEQAAQGTGLGLTICRHLAELMNGKIGVNSVIGEGSTFWLEVSFQQDSSQNSFDKNISKEEQLKGLKVLIVDESESNRDNIAHQLEEWNIEAIKAANAPSAMRYLEMAKDKNEPFSLAMIDHDMNEFSGLNLSNYIKRNQVLSETPLILMNAISDLEDTMVWTTAGVKSYLTKPIRQSDLYNALLATVSLPSHKESNKVSEETLHQSVHFNANILIAEDNPVNQELIELMLEGYGCTSKIVSNGKEFLDTLEENTTKPFDLFLMDCEMPLMNGYETTKKVRADFSDEVRIPIIALTANAMEGDREKCLAVGMDDYLTKPFNKEQLKEVLSRWLSNSTAPFQTDNPIEKAIQLEAQSTPVEIDEAEEFELDFTGENNPFDSDVIEAKVEKTELAKTVETEIGISNLLNRNTLSNIRSLQREGSPDILEKIVSLYLESSSKIIVDIEQAVKEKDAKAIRSTAHSLKSSSANLGADILAALCKDLELCGKEKRLEEIDDKVFELKRQYDVTCNALKLEIR